jgi:nucleosome assembly protein 1-like 1
LVFRTTIRDKIIPHAVSWFTGEAVQGEDFADLGDDDEDDDEDDDDDEDEEDDDEEEDEDEEEEESKPARKVGLQ